MEISTNPDKLTSTHPHFWRKHDTNVREDPESGDEVYALPLKEIRDYIASQEDTPLMREAVQRVMGSHGIHTQFETIRQGEKALGRCFLIATDKEGNSHPAIKEDWVHAQPEVFAILLGDTWGHTERGHTEEIAKIRKHQTAMSELIGWEPNMDRLKKEYCQNCGK